jgi:hypothetical protein
VWRISESGCTAARHVQGLACRLAHEVGADRCEAQTGSVVPLYCGRLRRSLTPRCRLDWQKTPMFARFYTRANGVYRAGYDNRNAVSQN